MHGEHRNLHLRGEDQHRRYSSPEGRHQGLVQGLRHHHRSPPLNPSSVPKMTGLRPLIRIGMFMVVPRLQQKE
jgi:hypothetical protein